jgi:hypothetical protein
MMYVRIILAVLLCWAPLAVAQVVWHTADQQASTGGSSDGVASRTVNAPTNLAEGDLIVLIGFSETTAVSTSTIITFPEGFTHHQHSSRSDSRFGPEVAIATKIATGSEPTTYQIDFAPEEPGRKIAFAGRVTGFDSGNVAGASSVNNSGGTAVTSIELASVAVTTADSLLVLPLASRLGYDDALTVTGMTTVFDASTLSIGAGLAVQTVSSETGTRTPTWTGAERVAALMIVINAPEAAAARRRIMMIRR